MWKSHFSGQCFLYVFAFHLTTPPPCGYEKMFIWVLTSLSTLYRSIITTGSFVGRGNQYIQLVSRFCTVNCRPSVSNYQISPHRVRGLNHRPQRWEVSVLPFIISSDFGYFSNISTLPSIMCVDKQSGHFKIPSRYFRKMFSIPIYRAYRHIPNL